MASVENRLTVEGWKAIAHYFDKSVRTVQDWEAEGLKINRVRKRVFAYVDDLETFKKSLLLVPDAALEPPNHPVSAPHNIPSSPRWRIISALACALVAVALFAFHILKPAKGRPATYETNVNTLIVKDGQGRELFRHEFPHKLAVPVDGAEADRMWAVGDIDGDGKPEVVYAYRPVSSDEEVTAQSKEVICFSSEGKIKWRFTPGRPVITDNTGERYSPPYLIAALKLIPLKPTVSTGPRVAVSSFHHMEQPDQVAVLDGSGRLVGEYWHPGWLRFMSTANLNHDGKEKLLLAGINNGDHSATLLVFDPSHVSGTATDLKDPRFGFPSLPPGTEEAVVLFPRSCIAAGPHRVPYNMVVQFTVTDDRIYVIVAEDHGPEPPVLIYELDYNLTVRSVGPNVQFNRRHAEMEQQGLLDHHLSDQDFKNMAARVIVRRKRQF